MLDMKKTDSLPPVRRGGGRTSAERKQIQEALESGEPIMIENVPTERDYPALQQRIRQAASAIGMKVTIRFNKHDDDPAIGDVYFQGFSDEAEEVVSESEVADAPNKSRSRSKNTASS